MLYDEFGREIRVVSTPSFVDGPWMERSARYFAEQLQRSREVHAVLFGAGLVDAHGERIIPKVTISGGGRIECPVQYDG